MNGELMSQDGTRGAVPAESGTGSSGRSGSEQNDGPAGRHVDPRPLGDLIEGGDPSLYGVTYGHENRQVMQFGTVFRLDSTGHRTLHRFTWLDGANPVGGLTLGSDGAIYGTTSEGGPGGRGVVFRLRLTASSRTSP